MADIPIVCANRQTAVAIPAATPTTVDVPIDLAQNWTIVLVNSGANPVTALTIAVSPLGTKFSSATSITDGIPLAAGSSLAAINGINQPVKTARLTVTSTLGTTIDIEAAGR